LDQVPPVSSARSALETLIGVLERLEHQLGPQHLARADDTRVSAAETIAGALKTKICTMGEQYFVRARWHRMTGNGVQKW
jgi:hypothetical protein